MSGTGLPTERELYEYYNKKALQLEELQATYEHPNWYKRFFYHSRFHAVYEVLDPRPGELILDLGSGPGYYSRHILQAGARVVAMDLARRYLENIPSDVQGRVWAHAQYLPFRDGIFDKVLATEVLEHTTRPESLLREVARILRTGGQAVVTSPSATSYMNRLFEVKATLLRYEFREHIQEFTREVFVRLLSSHFEVREMRFANCVLPYPLDLLAMHIPESIGRPLLTKLESELSRGRGGSSLGWTMIARVVAV